MCLGITYVWVQHANLYLLAMTRTNLNAAAIVLFLHRLVDVFKEYFEELEEESLRDNFVIVYELLDEVKTPSWKLTSHSPGHGFWLSSIHRRQDSFRVHQDRCPSNGG